MTRRPSQASRVCCYDGRSCAPDRVAAASPPPPPTTSAPPGHTTDKLPKPQLDNKSSWDVFRVRDNDLVESSSASAQPRLYPADVSRQLPQCPPGGRVGWVLA